MAKPVYILGISCFYHDAAAALLADGVPVAAAEEERFTRKKHDASFPVHAIRHCLSRAGIESRELDRVVFYEKPILKLDRIFSTFLSTWPRSLGTFVTAMPPFLKRKLMVERHVRQALGWDGPILYSDHHLSHAASAAFFSGLERTAVLTVDGVGEWASAAGWKAGPGELSQLWELRFPHSPGLLYTAFTQYLGFRVNSAECKVMGLAPYGRPVYRDMILDRIVRLRPDGSFRLELELFEFTWGRRMVGERFARLFGRPARDAESPDLEQFHMDVASSIQAVLDEIVGRMALDLMERTGLDSLCLAGGVALNCVANERARRRTGARGFFVQPAAGDAGGALGAAAVVDRLLLGNGPRPPLEHVYLGPDFSQAEIDRVLAEQGAVSRRLEPDELVRSVAQQLELGRVIGWFQGAMEFGPRALGNRSILADPRPAGMREKLNAKIKFREGFRPFAPAVPLEEAPRWFGDTPESPYMLLTAQVSAGLVPIPAVTHVDGSARLQTVRQTANPLFHALLQEFGRRTGVPILVNTSFNVRGEPIVCTPLDAWRCFMSSGLDDLVLGDRLLRKEDQPAAALSGGPRELD
ncbi:MAG: hypothetical protein HYY25_09965 [Candidatus Wallbacteria bacterium]|nr:hypothetical protein [Candidatus Wallbacteria bacterium]